MQRISEQAELQPRFRLQLVEKLVVLGMGTDPEPVDGINFLQTNRAIRD